MSQLLSPIRSTELTPTPLGQDFDRGALSTPGERIDRRARTPGGGSRGGVSAIRGAPDALSHSQSALGSRPASQQEAMRARSRQSSREQAIKDAKFKGRRRPVQSSVPQAEVSEGSGDAAAAYAHVQLTAEEQARDAELDKQEADMAEMEKKFELEMITMELNEKWEASLDNIPIACRERYRILLQSYSVFLKIKLYKFLALLDWTEEHCEKMYHILLIANKIPLERPPGAPGADLAVSDGDGGSAATAGIGASYRNTRIGWFLDKIHEYAANGWLKFIFRFFTRINDEAMREVLNRLTGKQLDESIELARFLIPTELELMFQYVDELSIMDVMKCMIAVEDPFVKACRLCRTRRIYALEHRLLYDQVPAKMIKVTGALAIYDKAETWMAQDEKQFTIDHDNGRVLWQKNVVDLMRICDKCLQDAHGACTSDGRFDDLWNLPAAVRKDALKKLRGREQQLASIIQKIAVERVNRRTKEWAIRALESQRLGQRTEREAREARQLEKAFQRKELEKQQNREQMMSRAGAVDRKWRDELAQHERKELSSHVHTAALNYMLDYTRDNPAPKTREHAHSWGNAHYLPDGTPVSPVGALERFGTYTIEPNEQKQQLTEWKQRAMESNEAFEIRINQFKEKKREAELATFEQHVEYVDKRIKRLNRQRQRLARTLDLEEQARIDKRAADRQSRAAIRWARTEALERWQMETEDDRSNRMRFYEWECLQIAREREGMWFEECEQCAVDKFWGFFIEEQRLDMINQKYKDFYAQRIADTRKKLILSKQIRPFKIEADMKIFKNPFTGEVLK